LTKEKVLYGRKKRRQTMANRRGGSDKRGAKTGPKIKDILTLLRGGKKQLQNKVPKLQNLVED
jgi:hypothetical protein